MGRHYFTKISLHRLVVSSSNHIVEWGGGQHFERRNLERLIFRNFKIANIKITKDELFDGFIIEFFFYFLEII